METKRLYYTEPTLKEFTTKIVEKLEVDQHPAVVLEATAFYPTSGGQPHDCGRLNRVPVIEVRERPEDGAILHLLANPLQGETVAGVLDWPRRFDHMQQHSGQHLLSQVFVRLAGAETVGFHLGEDSCTIDVNRPDISAEQLLNAEDMANKLIFENRAITARFVSKEELANIPLRKEPGEFQAVRVVEIEGFDWSACCGTHVQHTGEIGQVKLMNAQKRGEETRIFFLCGRRALKSNQQEHTIVRELALSLSVAGEDVPAAVEKIREEGKRHFKEKEELAEALLAYEAAELNRQAESLGRYRLITAQWDNKTVDQARRLAARLIGEQGLVVFFGIANDKAQLLFGRSEDVPVDMTAVLKHVSRYIQGGGGGNPGLAQGGGKNPAGVAEALTAARELVLKELKS
jgi:alanyl-tRNA synthetase